MAQRTFLTITNAQKIKVTVAPLTKAGKPAHVDGKLVWTVQSGDAKLDIAEDGFSAFLISGTRLSDSSIIIEGDSNLGENVEIINHQIILRVISPEFVGSGLTIDAPINK